MDQDERFARREPLVAPYDRGEQRIRRERGYRNVMPSGSGNEAGQEGKSNRFRYARIIGSSLFVIVLVVGAFFAAGPLMTFLERPLTRVTVEGEFLYVSKQRTSDLISAELDDDFLQLDLMRLKQVLESDPWVEHASLGRRWPDTLLVRIVEQKPIARWGDNGFMNQRGEIIQVDSTGQLGDLPGLYGTEADAWLLMQQYQDLSRLLRTRGLEVVALRCDDKRAWRMTLKNDIEVVIGRDQVMEKMRRFISVYDEHLHRYWLDVKSIDVRYTNGIAVQWIPESEAGAHFIKSS